MPTSECQIFMYFRLFTNIFAHFLCMARRSILYSKCCYLKPRKLKSIANEFNNFSHRCLTIICVFVNKNTSYDFQHMCLLVLHCNNHTSYFLFYYSEHKLILYIKSTSESHFFRFLIVVSRQFSR